MSGARGESRVCALMLDTPLLAEVVLELLDPNWRFVMRHCCSALDESLRRFRAPPAPIELAARDGLTGALPWLLQWNVPHLGGAFACCAAASNGRLGTLRAMICQHEFSHVPVSVALAAAKHGRVDVIVWMWDRLRDDARWCVCEEASRFDQVGVVSWCVRSFGERATSADVRGICLLAAACGSWSVAWNLIEQCEAGAHGAIVPDLAAGACRAAATRGEVGELEKLREKYEGTAWWTDSEAATHAAMAGQYHVLAWAHAQGLSIDPFEVSASEEAGASISGDRMLALLLWVD